MLLLVIIVNKFHYALIRLKKLVKHYHISNQVKRPRGGCPYVSPTIALYHSDFLYTVEEHASQTQIYSIESGFIA